MSPKTWEIAIYKILTGSPTDDRPLGSALANLPNIMGKPRSVGPIPDSSDCIFHSLERRGIAIAYRTTDQVRLCVYMVHAGDTGFNVQNCSGKHIIRWHACMSHVHTAEFISCCSCSWNPALLYSSPFCRRGKNDMRRCHFKRSRIHRGHFQNYRKVYVWKSCQINLKILYEVTYKLGFLSVETKY